MATELLAIQTDAVPTLSELYGEVKPRFDAFYECGRDLLFREEDIQEARLQPAPVLYGHTVYDVSQIDNPTGTYKDRGAINAALEAKLHAQRAGVPLTDLDTATAGNHGASAGLAARLIGVKAHAQTADSASGVKMDNMTSLGVDVQAVHTDITAAIKCATELGEQDGHHFLPPYNHPDVITGQGTLGLEVIQSMRNHGVVGKVRWLVPVGGGGLISGLEMARRYADEQGLLNDIDLELIGVQMAGGDLSNRAAQHYTSGRPWKSIEDLFPNGNYDADNDGTFAIPGNLTMAMLVETPIMTVSKGQVGGAMAYLSKRYGRNIEPAGALSRAGLEVYLREHAGGPRTTNITFTTGANVSPELYRRFMEAHHQERAEVAAQTDQELQTYRAALWSLGAMGVKGVEGVRQSQRNGIRVGTTQCVGGNW
ncbi:MAG TPA: pyridoxal-phosphate dependent enzyme [Candidatus Saccharimonadales bacterium]|nr:pyridoxal-phosphate dependent enzyme [Candidatus Saccharimonadales bacterium]